MFNDVTGRIAALLIQQSGDETAVVEGGPGCDGRMSAREFHCGSRRVPQNVRCRNRTQTHCDLDRAQLEQAISQRTGSVS